MFSCTFDYLHSWALGVQSYSWKDVSQLIAFLELRQQQCLACYNESKRRHILRCWSMLPLLGIVRSLVVSEFERRGENAIGDEFQTRNGGSSPVERP